MLSFIRLTTPCATALGTRIYTYAFIEIRHPLGSRVQSVSRAGPCPMTQGLQAAAVDTVGGAGPRIPVQINGLPTELVGVVLPGHERIFSPPARSLDSSVSKVRGQGPRSMNTRSITAA